MARIAPQFTYGRYASVNSIVNHLFETAQPVTTADIGSQNGHNNDKYPRIVRNCEIILFGEPDMSLLACVNDFTFSVATRCTTCNAFLSRTTRFLQTPPIIAFNLGHLGHNLPSIDPDIVISCGDTRIRYVLQGVIYYSNNHFTCHVITSTGMVWFHDGMLTGQSLTYESDNLATICTDRATMAFYKIHCS